MRIEHLKYFLNICETNSLNKSAQQLFVSQPALTKIIQSMENDYGMLLFQRSKRGIFPTEAGERLIPHAKNIIKEYDLAISSMLSTTTISKDIAILINPMLSMAFSDALYTSLNSNFPSFKFSISEIFTPSLAQLLESQQPAIGIIASENSVDLGMEQMNLQTIEIAMDKMVSVCAKNSKLSAHKVIDLDTIEDINCIYATYCFYHSRHRFPNQKVHYSYLQDSMLIHQQLQLNNNMIAVFPASIVCNSFIYTDIVQVPVLPETTISYKLVVSEAVLNSSLKNIVYFLVDTLRKLLNNF